MGGWDWATFLSQPAWLIDLIKGKMNLEATHREMESRQAERKSSSR